MWRDDDKEDIDGTAKNDTGDAAMEDAGDKEGTIGDTVAQAANLMHLNATLKTGYTLKTWHTRKTAGTL